MRLSDLSRVDLPAPEGPMTQVTRRSGTASSTRRKIVRRPAETESSRQARIPLSAEPTEAEREAIRYLDEVLQVEDINLVESVQRGMSTPAFTQGRIVNDPSGSGLSEHAVHHFHGLVLDAYRTGGG